MKSIAITAADSSAIAGHGYDPETKTLAIRFKSGKTYHYQGVDAGTYDAFKGSKSLGSFFGKSIRDNFTATPFEEKT